MDTMLTAFAHVVALSYLALGVRRYQGASLAITPFVGFALMFMATDWHALTTAAGIGQIGLFSGLLGAFGLIAFVTGFGIYQERSRVSAGDLYNYQGVPLTLDTSYQAYQTFVFISVIALLAIGTIQYRGLPPLTEAIGGIFSPETYSDQFINLRSARRDLTKGYVYGSTDYRGQGVLSTFLGLGWPFVTTSMVVLWRTTRRTYWLPAIATSLMLSALYVGGAGKRGPVVWAILTVVIGLSLTFRPRFRTALVASAAILLVVLLVTPLGRGSGQADSLAGRIEVATSRVLSGNGSNSVIIIDLIEEGALEPRGGTVLSNQVLAMMPGAPSQPFAAELATLRNRGGRTTYATPSFLGVLYADFTAAGVLVGLLLTGLGVSWVQVRMLRAPRTPLSIPLFACAAQLVVRTPTSTVLSTAVGFGVLSVIYALASFQMRSKVLRLSSVLGIRRARAVL